MNEFVEESLRAELAKAVDRQYTDWLGTLKAAGTQVQKSVSLIPAKDGKHKGEATFFLGPKTFTALYEYIPSTGSSPARWYMVRDWND